MKYPKLRLRRVRQSAWVRALVSETSLSANDLILPVFVREEKTPASIDRMPGVQRVTISELLAVAKEAQSLGVRALALFVNIPQELRNAAATEALNPEGLMCRAIREVKKNCPDIGIITDVALDQFTDHGQDGLIENGEILNDETAAYIAKEAVLHAMAGADIIAPSEMMDGRVGAIRQALDEAGYPQVMILSYTAKYASNFYGPFREALGSLHCLGQADKNTYQLNPTNVEEAMREAAQDLEEGADMLMVKPGLMYLDVLYRMKSTFKMPTFVYHVSGEFAFLKAAAAMGYLDYEKTLMECMVAFKRAGADGILTYGALEIARMLKGLPLEGFSSADHKDQPTHTLSA